VHLDNTSVGSRTKSR